MYAWQGLRNKLALDLPRAIKICFVLLCSVIVLAGCAITEQNSPPTPSNERTEATPVSQKSDSGVPLLNEQDLKRLDERFPKRQLEVLQNAKQIEVYEVDVTFTQGCPSDQELLPIKKNEFQGCRVLRHARVSDPEERKEFVDTVIYSIASWPNSNACWGPRHGIRAVHNEERIELLICFECENFRGAPTYGSSSVKDVAGNYVGGNRERFGGSISPEIEPLFERILSKASKK